MGHKKITPEQKAEIQRVYDRTGNKTETARITGLSLNTINRHTEKSKHFYTKKDRDNVIQVYNKTGGQLKEIAAKLKLSIPFVQRVLKDKPKATKKGIKKTPAPAPKEPTVKIKKLKTVIPKQKPDSFGKEVNIRRLPNRAFPPVYERISIPDRRLQIEVYSPEEAERVRVKYGLV